MKSALNNQTGATLRMTKNVYKCCFSWTITRQKKKVCTQLATDIKLSTTQISKTIQLGGFLRALLRKLFGSIMKTVCSTTSQEHIIIIRITAAASAANAGIQKTILS